ncbi:MAG TPA: cytochrome C oxidase subunit IV family protein, partial [Bacteroidia bacterium]|nr:cytochrome C oxidase subunit IV family protein [Bacteroidia bacterium]
FFISFTIVKAFYIVYTFMHLGDEVRGAKWIIIAPFTGFIIFLIFMLVMGEGNYQKVHRVDGPILTKEAIQADEGAAEKK